MIINRKIITFILTIFMPFLFISSDHFLRNKIKIHKKTNKKIDIKISKKSSKQKYNANLLINLLNIYNYLNTIQYKQKNLLKQIDDSSYNTIQKHAAIKHKYIKHANTIINDSDNSLKEENKKINKIISLIKIHPFTYQYFLSINNYIIPNYDFFTKSSHTNKYNYDKIKNHLYKINKTSNLNNISISTEEAAFSLKQISKTNSTLLYVVTKDFEFKANIICFNNKINSFQFMKLKNKTNSNIKKGIKNNYFRNDTYQSKNTDNKEKYDYIKRLSLTSYVSNINYPKYFNKHTTECFKTHLNIKNVKSFNENQTTYILFPIISGIILDSILIGIGGIPKLLKIIRKKPPWQPLPEELEFRDEYKKRVGQDIKESNNYKRWSTKALPATSKSTHEHITIRGPENSELLPSETKTQYCALCQGSISGVKVAGEDKFGIKKGETFITLGLKKIRRSNIQYVNMHQLTVNMDSTDNTFFISIKNEDEYHFSFNRIPWESNRDIYNTSKIITSNLIEYDSEGNKHKGPEVHLLLLSRKDGIQQYVDHEITTASNRKVVWKRFLEKYVIVSPYMQDNNEIDAIHLPTDGCQLKLKTIWSEDLYRRYE